MTATTAQDTSPDPTLTVAAGVEPRVPTDAGAAPLVEEDLLVEDVSIDGMCGVY
ncbi:MAG TPA: mycofactocin precursor MftA [Acidimicrobiales bacterium]|jgi:mycofactocin precursor